MRAAKIRPAHIEGYDRAEWILMDYFNFIVHVFAPQTREFYSLERLWGDAERIEVNDESGSGGAPEPDRRRTRGEAPCVRSRDSLIAVLLAPLCAACDATARRTQRADQYASRAGRASRPFTPPVCNRCGDPLPSWRHRALKQQVCPRCRRAAVWPVERARDRPIRRLAARDRARVEVRRPAFACAALGALMRTAAARSARRRGCRGAGAAAPDGDGRRAGSIRRRISPGRSASR